MANQTGGILHSPPTTTQGGSSLSTLVMTISLTFVPLHHVMLPFLQVSVVLEVVNLIFAYGVLL